MSKHRDLKTLMRDGPKAAPVQAKAIATPAPQSTVVHLKHPLFPVAPVLTCEMFDQLRAAKEQTGTQHAYTIYPDVQKYMDRVAGQGYNRPIHTGQVNKYAKRMELGTWRLDGNVCQYDWNGNRINGAHRGAACIQSDKPYAVYLSFGHDPQDYQTMDAGAKRVASDLFHQNNWSYPKIAAYTATWICRYRDDDFCGRSTYEPDHLFARAVGFGKDTMTKCIKVGIAVSKLTGIPAQYIAAAYYLARAESAGEADKFFGAWARGEGLPVCKKVSKLIQKMHADFHKAVLDTIQVAMVILAWNLHALGGRSAADDLSWHPQRLLNGVMVGNPDPVVLAYVKGRV